jgi:hypothetical protein
VSRLPSGLPYIVMEYLEGQDLRELIEREGNPGIESLPRCVHFVLQILRGLQVAHRAKVVHRDMKPANCFVTTKDGEPDFIKLVDFGISKLQAPDAVHLTDAGTSLGTPLYMAPEQARNPKNVDARADLYATATILYELIAGRTPFIPESGTLTELLFKLGVEEPPRIEEFRPDIPADLAEVIHHGLVKDPKVRFQSASEFAEAIAPYADGRSTLVLTRMLHRHATGMSHFPPPQGPPTFVDQRRPSYARISVRPPGSGTEPLAAPEGGTQPIATLRSGDGAMAVADTALSASVNASGAAATTVDRPRRNPVVMAAIAAALTGTALAVGWSLMRSTPDAPVSTGTEEVRGQDRTPSSGPDVAPVDGDPNAVVERVAPPTAEVVAPTPSLLEPSEPAPPTASAIASTGPTPTASTASSSGPTSAPTAPPPPGRTKVGDIGLKD